MVSMSVKLGNVEKKLSYILDECNDAEGLINGLPNSLSKSNILNKIKTIKTHAGKSLELMNE